ncbi:MAG TPA: SGNH/GDSL hydrolase family protein [Isosphaeraceae bacterium]
MRPDPGRLRRLAPLGLTAALLALGLVPVPRSAGWARSALLSLRSPEPNRADREAVAGGYYEDLLGPPGGGAGDEPGKRLPGRPAAGPSIHDLGAIRYRAGDFLGHDLVPNLRRTAFGRPFATNAFGLRDRPNALGKPPGTFRIALLGSSIDMGWGVGNGETYGSLLEAWLNAHAARRGLARRFEVLNFAVAAYGPAQRLESYRRKAVAFRPDLVLYSATMLDPRLSAIHLGGLLRDRTDLRYDFVRRCVAAAGLTAEDLRRGSDGALLHRDAVKAKLRPVLWPLADGALGELAASCRAGGRPLVGLIVPRVGLADAPDARAEAVARHRQIAARHGVPVIDLSGTFDDQDPADLKITPGDDHPNALGHRLLFLALARALVDDESRYRTLFSEARDQGPGTRDQGR